MNDFIREIQEDIERQKWMHLWQRYGRALAIGACVVLGGAALWQVAEFMQSRENTQQTDALLSAVEAADVATFDRVAPELDGVHYGLLQILKAQMLINRDLAAESKAALDELVGRKDSSMPYDLARSISGASGQTSEVFKYTHAERSAWAALQAGDMDAAKASFAIVIEGENVPPSLMDRAKAGLAYVAAQGAAAPAAKE